MTNFPSKYRADIIRAGNAKVSILCTEMPMTQLRVIRQT